MFAINHAATALIVKKRFPEAPMWLLLISVQLMEMLWVALNYIGVEYSTTENMVSSVLDVHLSYMPYSHSILSTFVLCFVAWFTISKWFNKPPVAWAVAIAIASHLVLDLLTHSQDIAFAPLVNMDKFGLGLYAMPMLAFIFETVYGIFCWWIYRGSNALLLTIVLFNLANFSFLSTTISGLEVYLANNPMLLTTVVFIQIVVTLVLVGVRSRRGTEYQSSSVVTQS